MSTVLRSSQHKDLTPQHLVQHFEFGVKTWAFDVIEYLLSWGGRCAPDIGAGMGTGWGGARDKVSQFCLRPFKFTDGKLDYDHLRSEYANPNGDFAIADRLCSLAEIIAMCIDASRHFNKGLLKIYPNVTKSDAEEIKLLIRNPLAHEITTRNRVQFDRRINNFQKIEKLSGEIAYNVCAPEWYEKTRDWFADYFEGVRTHAKSIDIQGEILDFDCEYSSKVKSLDRGEQRQKEMKKLAQGKNSFQLLYLFMCYPDEEYR